MAYGPGDRGASRGATDDRARLLVAHPRLSSRAHLSQSGAASALRGNPLQRRGVVLRPQPPARSALRRLGHLARRPQRGLQLRAGAHLAGLPLLRRVAMTFRPILVLLLSIAALFLVLVSCGNEESVTRLAPYDGASAGQLAQVIRQTYETRFSELDRNAQAHFAVRIFRATGETPNLEAVTLDIARWIPDLEEKLDSLHVDGYLEQESRIAHARKREVSPVLRARKKMFASRKEMLYHRRVLYIAYKLREFGLHEGYYRDLYEAARAHLRTVDFERFLLDAEVIRTYAAQTSNLVFWLKRIDVLDLEEPYTRAYQEVFMGEDDDDLVAADYQNKLYGLTHFIIGDSHYYQRTISAEKHAWILDYFDRYILEILSWSKPDIIAEIALCFRLCGLRDHRVVHMAEEYLAEVFDPELGHIPSGQQIGDFSMSEHRNAVAYLVLADWEELHEGPYLNEDAVRAYVPLEITPPSEPPRLPVGGEPVAELRAFDWAMLAYMEANEIGAGLLGVMKDGEVVLQRSYGWSDAQRSEPLEPTAMMRIASVTKPFTAAAIRRLVSARRMSLEDRVFDLGQEGGGLLQIDPFPALGDPRYAEITLRHLLEHTAGWDADVVGDLTFRELKIAEAMGISAPPQRAEIARWILGRPLQHAPGERQVYSNEGFLFLGLIIEEVTGRDYMDYLWSAVLRPADIAQSEIAPGHTRPGDRLPREPWYESRGRCASVFVPDTRVPCAYGGWCLEEHVSSGRLVASPRAVLKFLESYYVIGSRIGLPRRGDDSGRWSLSHTGGFPGTSALARQRGDGINFAVLFNKQAPEPGDYALAIRELLDRVIERELDGWPE
ncbi:MAG: DUF3541 domain-containing protein [Candidatus Eisenbacteria bacterium]|nr:DUF3541 domain-containing protein [Candidatus Eisenbacteria bacterium]